MLLALPPLEDSLRLQFRSHRCGVWVLCASRNRTGVATLRVAFSYTLRCPAPGLQGKYSWKISKVKSLQVRKGAAFGGHFETLIIRINHMLPVFAKCVVDVVAKWLYRPEDHMQICCILSRNLARLAFLFPGLVCWTDTKSLIKLQKHLVRSKWKASRNYSRWFQETWMINESMNSFLNRISALPNSSFAPGSSRRLKRGTHCCNVIT